MRKIIYTSYCLFIFFFVFLETSCLLKSNTGQFVLINDSDELISRAIVEVCGQLPCIGPLRLVYTLQMVRQAEHVQLGHVSGILVSDGGRQRTIRVGGVGV